MRWLPNVLSAVFGRDTSHWVALKHYMEEHLGEVVVYHPVEGGSVLAFFEKVVLVGDTDKYTNKRSSDGLITLDMREPIGKALTTGEAVLRLWDQVVNVAPAEDILKFQGLIQNGELPAYKSYKFRNGHFVCQGDSYHLSPPDRLKAIESALADMRYHGLISSCENEVFGPLPQGAPARLWANESPA